VRPRPRAWLLSFLSVFLDSGLTFTRWGPLFGPGKAFDTSKFFIFCGNALGSPYGSASPVTISPDNGLNYGPEFPLVTIRDDVKYAPLKT
jgi:homoserine acetyltransferase